MEEFLTKLNTYLEAAETAVIGIAPDVWTATLKIIWVQGVIDIAIGVLPLAAFVAMWFFERKVWTWGLRETEKSDAPVFFISGIYSGAHFGMLCLWLKYWSLGAWLAVFSPETALVYRVGQTAGIF